ncbi:MAG: hypothetical protein H0T39_02410, partial [Actinobacteria bacterium]|nr:hypothetical protein [Actinomycetota bacterium]
RAYVGTFTGEKLKAALVEAQAAASALERFDDQAMLAQAHWAVGVFHFWLGDCAGADRALRRALDHARRGGRSRDEGEVLSSLVMVARHGATPVPEAIRLCETTLERARGSHSKLEAQALLSAGVLSAMRGAFDEARAAVRQAGAITRDLARLDWAGGAMESAAVELLADDPGAAELIAREGYDELERLGEKGYLSTIAPILARAVYLQGRYEEAEQLTRVSEGAADPDDVSSQSGWRSVRALALASRGRTEEAVTLARGGDDHGAHGLPRLPCRGAARPRRGPAPELQRTRSRDRGGGSAAALGAEGQRRFGRAGQAAAPRGHRPSISALIRPGRAGSPMTIASTKLSALG